MGDTAMPPPTLTATDTTSARLRPSPLTDTAMATPPTATDLTDTAMLPVPTVMDTATTRDPLMPRLLTVTDTLPVPTAMATDLTATAMLPVPTATTTKLSKTSPSSILLSANQKKVQEVKVF